MTMLSIWRYMSPETKTESMNLCYNFVMAENTGAQFSIISSEDSL